MSTVHVAQFDAGQLNALTPNALEAILLKHGFRFSGERRIAFLLPFVSNVASNTTMVMDKDGGVTFMQDRE